MKAGLLNEPIAVYKSVITKDEYGQEKTDWVEKCKTRARLKHDSGDRTIENNEVVFNHTKTFEVRKYVQVADTDRIYWNNQRFRILNIEPDRILQSKIIKTELIND